MSVNTEAAELLRLENKELRARLEKAEQTLRAIKYGEVDALVPNDTANSPKSAYPASSRFRDEVLAQINEAVIATDTGQRMIYLNTAAEQQYGMSAKDAIGENLDNIFRTHWLDPVDESEAARELEENGFWRGENMHVTAAGVEFYAESTVSLRRDNDGEPAGLLYVIRNVTERKHTEQELSKRDERYRAFIEQSTEGIWRFELEEPIPIDLPVEKQIELAYRYGYLAECNTAMARQYGRERAEDLIGARLVDFYVEDDPNNDKILREFIESGYRVTEAESHEKGLHSEDKYFLNNFVGIIEDGKLVRGWGSQRDITGSKRSQDAIAHLAAIVESSDDAIVSKDLNGVITSWNKGATQIFGYSADEVIGRPVTILIPDNRLDEEPDILQKIRAGEPVDHYETKRRRKDGTEIDVSLTVSPIRNERGEIIGASKIARDITEQKLARAIWERYHLLSMQAKDIILFLNVKTGQIVEANQAAIDAYGYDRETLLTMGVRDLRAPETLGVLEQQYNDADVDGIQFETIHQKADGTKFPVEVSAVGSDVGGERLIISIIRDITERQIAQETLNQNQAMLAIAMQSSRMGVLEWDIASGSVWWSEELEEIFGLGKGEFRGDDDHFLALIHEDDREAAWAEIQRAVEEHRAYRIEFRFLHTDGSIRWMEGRGEAVYSQKGEPVRIYGVGIDITERKQADERLRETEERFSKAFNSSPLMLTISSLKTGKLIEVNETFVSVTGYTRDEAIGKTTKELRLWSSDDARKSELEAVSKLGQVRDLEYDFVIRDGSVITGLLSAERIDIGGEQFALTVIQDITERKRNELNQAFLLSIGELIRETQEADEMIKNVSGALGRHLNVDRCFFNDINLNAGTAAVRREYLRSDEMTSFVGTASLDSYSPQTKAEIERGRTVVVTDTNKDPRIAESVEIYQNERIGAYIAAPLMRDGRWHATLWVSTEQPRAWSEWETALVQTVAERSWLALEKLRSEKILRESEERFRNMADNAPVMIWVTGVDGHCTYLSKSWYEFTGQTPETALGFGWIEVVHADEQEDLRRTFLEANNDRETFEVEHRLVRKDGEHRWVIDSAQPRFGRDHEFLGFIGSVVDITERKMSEEKIRQSEERYRSLANAMPQLVWTADSEGNVDYYNSLAANYEGINYDQGSNTWNWKLTVHPDDRETTEEAWKNALRGDRYEVEHRIKMKDGTYRWHLSRAHVVKTSAEDNGGKWFGTATDIHEHKLAQEALVKAERRATEEYFQMLSRIVPIAQALGTARDLLTVYRAVRDFIQSSMPCSGFFVSFYDAESRMRKAAYVWGENGELDISTLPPIELTEDGGPNSQAVFQRRSVIVNRYMDVMSTRPHLVVEENGINPNSALAVPMIVMDRVTGTIEVQAYDNDAFNQEHVIALEMVANLAAVAIENVRLIEIEARARHDAEAANRMKDEFLSILSHELRTPLNAMLGWVRMLRAGILDEERSAKALEVIERNTRQQSSLIEDLLDVSRIISGKMRIEKELVDVRAIVKDVSESMRPLALNKGVNFNVSVTDEPLFLNGDAMRLQQVITNLIQNAIKFTPADGSIGVAIEKRDDSAILVVRDTGIGIDQEFLPNIFDRFSQADASTRRSNVGLGLGLTIVSTIVDLHGGEITSASEGVGKGAAFTVTLPLAEEFYKNGTGPSDVPLDPGTILNGLRLLLVDDDTESLIPLQIFLEREGARVECAGSADDALALLAEHDFDVIVSDIGMPGTDGYELARQLRMTSGPNSGIAAVAVTAFVSPEHRVRAVAAGYDAHLSKPIDFEELLMTVKNTYDGKN